MVRSRSNLSMPVANVPGAMQLGEIFAIVGIRGSSHVMGGKQEMLSNR